MKLAPLADVPNNVPPVGTVYHLMVFPADIALRLVEAPQVMDDGDADTPVGGSGGATFTVTDVLVSLTQPAAFHAIITCPLPVLYPGVCVTPVALPFA